MRRKKTAAIPARRRRARTTKQKAARKPMRRRKPKRRRLRWIFSMLPAKSSATSPRKRRRAKRMKASARRMKFGHAARRSGAEPLCVGPQLRRREQSTACAAMGWQHHWTESASWEVRSAADGAWQELLRAVGDSAGSAAESDASGIAETVRPADQDSGRDDGDG